MQVRFDTGEQFKGIKALVDTGSRLPLLFRTGLSLRTVKARYPVALRTADGSVLQGGKTGNFVTLKLPVVQQDDIQILQWESV